MKVVAPRAQLHRSIRPHAMNLLAEIELPRPVKGHGEHHRLLRFVPKHDVGVQGRPFPEGVHVGSQRTVQAVVVEKDAVSPPGYRRISPLGGLREPGAPHREGPPGHLVICQPSRKSSREIESNPR